MSFGFQNSLRLFVSDVSAARLFMRSVLLLIAMTMILHVDQAQASPGWIFIQKLLSASPLVSAHRSLHTSLPNDAGQSGLPFPFLAPVVAVALNSSCYQKKTCAVHSLCDCGLMQQQPFVWLL